jgi:hypothetical protein
MSYHKLSLPILFVLTVLFLGFSRVSNVECYLHDQVCPPDLMAQAQTLKGSSFFFSNFDQKLMQSNSFESIYILNNIQKKLPSTLKLYFNQEEIEYALLINNEKKFIGQSGVAIPNQTETNNILIIQWQLEQSIIENNLINPDYHQIFLAVARTLTQSNLKNPVILWVSDTQILIDFDEHPRFIFDKQTIQTQIQKVDTIISARELDEINEPILEIDMRFDLPVLRTSQ